MALLKTSPPSCVKSARMVSESIILPDLRRIVLASNNAGKRRELGALLKPLGFELVSQASLGVGAAAEPYETFVENALAKARHAANESGLPALADDSGLSVAALGGAPGVHSARFACEGASDEDNNAYLLKRLASRPQADDRLAFYYCVLVFLRSADDPCPYIAEGRWAGRIALTARGSNGFGYDPIFELPGCGRTVAQLDDADKNTRSHRALALKQLLKAFH